MNSNYFFRASASIILVAILSFSAASGQQKKLCATDIVTRQLLAQHPELLEKYNQSETYTRNYVKTLEAKKAMKAPLSRGTASSAPAVYIIPIVFHILHQNGPENISDAQIMDEMRILNEDWGHMNPDTSDACTPYFKSIEGNIQVQFRLAQIDPNGNCTNGIDRIYTNLTNNANDVSKINWWNRTKYVNVWVVKSITVGGTPDVAGYAYFPFEVDAPEAAAYDGVLILSNYIGSIGTSSPLTSRALSHELGHVMNLEHPWGLTNSPGVSCGDDGVGDTPETEGYDYCPADSNHAKICDTVSKSPLYVVTENYQNFMDYSYCSMMFTQGQQERIWAALNTGLAERNNLWDTANLIATGVYTPATTECVPMASFYGNTCYVCQGASVDFYDASTNAEPTNWLWAFTGANVNSSTMQNPVVTYDSLYSQTVSLTVSDSVGSNTLTRYGYVYVSPLWTSYFGTFSEGFENPSEVNTNWLFQNVFNDGISWQYTNTAASTGTGSLMLNSLQANIYNFDFDPPVIISPATGPNAVWNAITPSVNLQTASSMSLSFDYSCATEATSANAITETLGLLYSLDCGANWVPIRTISGPTLTNGGFWTTAYTPSSPSDWNNISIPLSTAINGQPNVRFMFQYTSGIYSNNIYIDNVNLSGTVGIDPISAEDNHLLVYPDPMSTEATISYSLASNQPVNIGLYDLTGRELKELANGNQIAGQHTLGINNEGLSEGVYFIKMVTNTAKSVTRKLIIIK